MPITVKDFLLQEYENAMTLVGSSEIVKSDLNLEEQALLNTILEYSEQAKGVLTVLVTSLVYKILNPHQDIRKHQEGIPGGYSGRTFDTKNITPFLKECKFPAMAESGWLTRSLEQKVPYDKDYTGAIRPDSLKLSFLSLLENIQNGTKPEKYLTYIFQGLIIQRNQHKIDLAKPTALSIETILNILNKHFHSSYKAEGASRLPVIAFYAIYQCLINEMKRFQNKTLLPIESHTSADRRSGRIGDIEIIDENKRSFEAIEVKHGIDISLQLILDAYSKFQSTPVNRYYILSTAPYPGKPEWDEIQYQIQKIKNIHGCQVIVNGIIPTLKYYLRLLNNTFEFIDKYVELLEKDNALKFEHKESWNKIIGELSIK